MNHSSMKADGGFFALQRADQTSHNSICLSREHVRMVHWSRGIFKVMVNKNLLFLFHFILPPIYPISLFSLLLSSLPAHTFLLFSIFLQPSGPSLPSSSLLNPTSLPFFLTHPPLPTQHQTSLLTKARCWSSSQQLLVALPSSSSSPSSSWSRAGKSTSLPLICMQRESHSLIWLIGSPLRTVWDTFPPITFVGPINGENFSLCHSFKYTEFCPWHSLPLL